MWLHCEKKTKGVIVKVIFEEWYGRHVRGPDDNDIINVMAIPLYERIDFLQKKYTPLPTKRQINWLWMVKM